MKTAFAILMIAMLPTAMAANCTISGDWDDDMIAGGEKAEYELEISPSGGFVDIKFKNEFGDVMWSEDDLQITSPYTIKIPTQSNWYNGSYNLWIEYDEMPNGTDCGKSLTSNIEIMTTYNKTASLTIDVEETYTTEAVERTCTPVSVDGKSYDVCVEGQATKGLAESVFINGVQVKPGQNMGNLELSVTTCNEDVELQTSVKALDDKLLTMSNERDMLMVENGKLNALICGEGGNLIQDQVGQWKCQSGASGGGYLAQIEGLNGRVSDIEMERNSRWDGGSVVLAVFLTAIAVVFALIFLNRIFMPGREVIYET